MSQQDNNGQRREPVLPSITPDSDEVESRRRTTPPKSVTSNAPRRGGFGSFLMFLILLSAMGAGGYFGYEMYESLNLARAELAETRNELADTRTQLADTKTQVEGARTQLAGSGEKIARLESRLTSADEDMSRAGADVGNQLTGMGRQLNALNKQLEAANSEIRKLWGVSNDRNRKSIQSNTDSLNNLDKGLKDLQTSLDSLRSSTSNRTSEAQTAVDQIDQIAAGFGRLEAAFDETRQELLLEMEGLRSIRSQQQGQTQRLTEMNSLMSAMEAKLNDFDEDVTAINQHRRQLSQQILALQRDINTLQDEL